MGAEENGPATTITTTTKVVSFEAEIEEIEPDQLADDTVPAPELTDRQIGAYTEPY
jgi:hypothetical protein